MTRYVVVFAFNAIENAVVLLLKTHPEWQCGRLNGPGGKVQQGENAFQAARREFEEETGVVPKALMEFCELVVPGGDVVHFFRATVDEPPQTKEEEPVVFVPVYPLPGNVVDNLRWLVPMALGGSRKEWPYRVEEFPR